MYAYAVYLWMNNWFDAVDSQHHPNWTLRIETEITIARNRGYRIDCFTIQYLFFKYRNQKMKIKYMLSKEFLQKLEINRDSARCSCHSQHPHKHMQIAFTPKQTNRILIPSVGYTRVQLFSSLMSACFCSYWLLSV